MFWVLGDDTSGDFDPTLVGELDRVAAEVEQDLLDPDCVARHVQRERGGQGQVEFKALFRGAGALQGRYAGASAEATVAVGLGANVLVGGGNKSIALQPLSVQAQTGLNVAAGVAALRLKAVKK